ncbi:Calmodulin-A-like isoform X1 [Oopsacas minuta]|uniref:Calmodulin-A-like isoform X1 n=1 Tax=Oopsacas minuta TaxID=111878 RepID=A0AAV7K865_9METZ|nr:Calmodulin-A-like isoform X1 [Oopsacas minuta]
MAGKSEGASAERIKELSDMFKSFDKDGDGRITFLELKEALESIGDYKSEKDIRDMINEVDQDKNGTIEFNEFAIYFDKNIKEMQARRDEMELTFNTFDIDGDGFITFKELTTVFSSMGEDMSEQSVKDMITKVDLNHDGKLDFNEFTKLWKKLNTEDDN